MTQNVQLLLKYPDHIQVRRLYKSVFSILLQQCRRIQLPYPPFIHLQQKRIQLRAGHSPASNTTRSGIPSLPLICPAISSFIVK